MSELSYLLGLLRRFPEALNAQLDAVPESAIDFAPNSWEGVPSEELTIRQQICHLRDIETDGYAVRFARVLSEENSFLASVDTYALVSSRDYDRTNIIAAFDAFASARSETIEMLAGAKTVDLNRIGEFEGYGPVTLKGLVHFLVSHDQQHLSGIQWLLGKYESAK